jgi:isoleucyl-tRNA synthetase
MAAARAGTFELLADGSVRLAGVTLAPDEVEILAAPRAGTAVAHDEGLVVVIDTELNDELRAEGDARELQRAIQDARRAAGLELADRIDVWLDGRPELESRLAPHLPRIATEVLAARVRWEAAPADATPGEASLEGGAVRFAVRRAEALGEDRPG